jgi:hypothetical protein
LRRAKNSNFVFQPPFLLLATQSATLYYTNNHYRQEGTKAHVQSFCRRPCGVTINSLAVSGVSLRQASIRDEFRPTLGISAQPGRNSAKITYCLPTTCGHEVNNGSRE